jgi:hypothetical protein
MHVTRKGFAVRPRPDETDALVQAQEGSERVCVRCAELVDRFDPAPGQLTPYRELDDVLTGYAGTLRESLGETFVGLYTLGSLAIGDFDLTSDVDLIVVTMNDLSAEQLRRVESEHQHVIAGQTRWVRHLEYSFFPLGVLDDLTSPYTDEGERNASASRLLWYYNNGQAQIERSDHDNTLVTRWTLRYKSQCIDGQEPRSFAPTISSEDLSREIRQSMLGWEQRALADPSQFDNRFHQVFMVLNNCRALQDLHEGRITSKREGVAWAKQQLDPRWHALIEYSWHERQDASIHVSQAADPDAFRQTLAFIEYTTRLAENVDVTHAGEGG